MAMPAPFARRRLGRRLSAVSVAVAGGLALAVAGAVGVAAAPTLHRSGDEVHATLTASPPTAAPTVTPLCNPGSGKYAWEVSTTQTLSNYNIDYAKAVAGPWPGTEVTSPKAPFTFTTPSSLGLQLYVRWDSSPNQMTAQLTADTTACPTAPPTSTPTPTAVPTPTPTATPTPTPTPTTSSPTPTPTPAPTSSSGDCSAAAWVSNQAYVSGNVVSYGGDKWTANQWNYDEVPGGASGAWNNDGPC